MLTTDPLVTTDPDLLPLDEVIERSDILIVCTPHSLLQGRGPQGQAGRRRLGPAARPHQRHLVKPVGDAMPSQLDIVIPVYNEGENIVAVLRAPCAERQERRRA